MYMQSTRERVWHAGATVSDGSLWSRDAALSTVKRKVKQLALVS